MLTAYLHAALYHAIVDPVSAPAWIALVWAPPGRDKRAHRYTARQSGNTQYHLATDYFLMAFVDLSGFLEK